MFLKTVTMKSKSFSIFRLNMAIDDLRRASPWASSLALCYQRCAFHYWQGLNLYNKKFSWGSPSYDQKNLRLRIRTFIGLIVRFFTEASELSKRSGLSLFTFYPGFNLIMEKTSLLRPTAYSYKMKFSPCRIWSMYLSIDGGLLFLGIALYKTNQRNEKIRDPKTWGIGFISEGDIFVKYLNRRPLEQDSN